MTEKEDKENAENTEDEIKLYGQLIGLDIDGPDKDLKWIAV
jgi:hypothetical protein